MSNLFLGVYLFGGALILFLVFLSTRRQDLEHQDNLKAAVLGSITFGLFFVVFVSQVILDWREMSEAQLLVASLVASCFSLSAVFLGMRAYVIRKSRLLRS